VSRRRGTARDVAAVVVARVLDEGAWVGSALDAALEREGAGLEPRDRALATELSYGTLRWAAPLEASLLRGADKPGRGLDKRLRPHLLVAAYQLQHLQDRVPAHAAVNEAVETVRRVRPGLVGFANALLRHLGSAPHEQLADTASLDDMALAYGLPELVVGAVTAGLPDVERRFALAALNERPPLGLRWLGPVGGEEELLTREGVRRHPFVPGALLAHGIGSPDALPGWREGHLLVMDPGSQVCALLVAPADGATALDVCAAPGGKAALLAAAAGPTGRVLAIEQDPRRARRVQQNAQRLGLSFVVETVVADGTALPLAPAASFDVVLVDAPCSGLGTVRRHPEIRFRRSLADIEELAALQARLLEAAAARVRPGGALVYAVCTPTLAEGPEVVRAFLAAHGEFRTEAASARLSFLPDDALTPEGWVRLFVHRHDADAFFAARLVRG
jgi:16S rRNA (cytosine967-C5)-methyltransferase